MIGDTNQAMPKIVVVNLRNDLLKLPTIRIDRRTWLGNPFIIGKDGDRDEVIEKFKIYFDKFMLSEPNFKQEFYKLAEQYSRYEHIQLACWCSPQKCHGDILKQALEEIYRDTRINKRTS
jgi:hypothetical protein